jgi:NitT/TauT family transport system permease protein
MSAPIVIRIVILAVLVAALEALSRLGIIDRFTMPAPSRILTELVKLLASGAMWPNIAKTMGNVAVACTSAIAVGILTGALIHRWKGLRNALDPVFAAYYAVPIYAFYPLFIIMFGLGDGPQILIGFMLGVIAVVVNTLNGLDRVPPVLFKTARIHRLGPIATALRISLPCAVPHIFTGVKLAVAYSFIGVIGAEFIMSRSGLGYEIGYAYNNFDNDVMYPLIVFVLLVATVVNMLFYRWEKTLLARRKR